MKKQINFQNLLVFYIQVIVFLIILGIKRAVITSDLIIFALSISGSILTMYFAEMKAGVSWIAREIWNLISRSEEMTDTEVLSRSERIIQLAVQIWAEHKENLERVAEKRRERIDKIRSIISRHDSPRPTVEHDYSDEFSKVDQQGDFEQCQA